MLTQAYCELQLKNTDSNFASILRSFNPVYNGRELFSFNLGNYYKVQWFIDPLYNKDLYDELFEMQLKNKRDIIMQTKFLTRSEGRMLVADIDWPIRDGISEEASTGFIDYNDCPPIDTWFYMANNYHLNNNSTTRILFAWIPQQFVHIVEEGIAVNLLDVFYWLDDYKESRYTFSGI